MPATELDDAFFESEPAALEGMQYWRAYQYIFEHPNWFMNVLLIAICQLIPLVGPIVMSGYQFELLEALHRRPRAPYPEFNFDRFVEYLSRGIWPFLVSLVVSLAWLPLVGLVIGTLVFAVSAVGVGPGQSLPPEIGVILGLGIFVFFFAAVILFWLVAFPMVLRAGIMCEFGAAFHWGFIKNFISRMWVEMALVTLFMMVTAIPIVIAGYLAFCVGVYLAIAVILLAQAHLQYQLYELYLARGGEPIPFKPSA